MKPLSKIEALDRHALVMSIWLSLGFVAATLFGYGFGNGGTLAIVAAFGAVLAAFAGHIIVNTIYATMFTRRELALGLVLYAAALMAFALAALFSPGFASSNFLPLGLGFVAIPAAVIFYLITHLGARRAFDAFDVISDFRSRSARDEEPDGGRR